MKKNLTTVIALLCFVMIANSQYETMSPITGAKMYFSDKPFTTSHEGSKTSFKSGDFIYGRIELDNQTLLDAFKMSSIKTKYYYLRFWVTAYKNGEQSGSKNPWEYLLIKDKEDIGKNYFNFDILPNPKTATSALCGLDDFTSNIAGGPLYFIVNPESFPEDGEYSIKVRLFLSAYDGWGKEQEVEKWPEVIDEFKFQFDSKDIQALKKNGEAGNELVRKNTFRLSNLPEYFSNPNKLTDPTLSNANIASVLKRDLPGGEMKLLKFAVGNYTGSLWQVEKNDLGIMLRRFVTPDINIVYQFQDDCYVGYARLWQEYIGGGKYGGLIVGDRTCNSCGQKIDCSKVK
ncbi:hypothetical protein BH10BAC3_BH10BAC3_23690 [soil metagenome]